MIPFPCPACDKNLAVKEELAGKEVRCPHCGQVVAIPAAAALAHSSEATAAPPPQPGEQRGNPQPGRPSQPEANDAPTVPPRGDPEATEGVGRPDGPALGLTTFLEPPQAEDELGRLGKYRILRVLGQGGMGVVFLAEDPHLRRKVAIKAMLPTLAASASAGQRFLREAQAMAALKHDHVATIYQVDEEGGVPFLAMEFLAGETLEDRLGREGKLPVPEVLRIGREAAEGLGAAHATGLIHRDVKPSNVWLEAPRGRVKILDFGLARAAPQDAGVTEAGTGVVTPTHAAPGLTQQGAILGTPAYMSPEQAGGEPVDARSDLFSLGCVLYRMLTGRRPFQGKDALATLRAVTSHQPPPPARLETGVPRALSALVMRLLEKEAARRPASAEEVAGVLRALGGKPKAGRARTAATLTLISLALLPLGWWLATVAGRSEPADGTLLIEVSDAEAEARIKDGKVVLTDAEGRDRYTLTPAERERRIDAGAYKVRVEGADGLRADPPGFALGKGGQVRVRVSAGPPAAVTAPEPDRRAAEYMLSIRGEVRIDGQDRDIRVPQDLPQEPFRLTGLVHNGYCTELGDAVMAHFMDCKHLTHLELGGGSEVGDAGLTLLEDYTNLTYLKIDSAKVTDVGLACFTACKRLKELHLIGPQVSDVGLAHFKDCKGLTHLHVESSARVSDAGLAHFKDCESLTHLDLSSTRVGDVGLVHLKGCKSLTFVKLEDTRVGDVGLAHFKGCKGLRELHLARTHVGDEGVAHFKDCKGLTLLDLHDTQVGDAGLAHFKDCVGLVELRVSGMKVSDAGLTSFKGCKSLTHLALENTKVSDEGLAHFKGCTGLVELNLTGTRVGNAGLALFKDCKSLGYLSLHNTQVSDVGLDWLKDCKSLTFLSVGKTKVTTAKVKELKKALPQCLIYWDGGYLAPAG